MSKPSIKTIIDKSDMVLKALRSLELSEVLVGVPADEDRMGTGQGSDTRQGKDQPNNALLAAVHNNGSPVKNIPARPFLVPGIENVRKEIRKRMRDGAKLALEGNVQAVDKTLHAVGLLGQAAVRKQLTDGSFEPLKPATIMARSRVRGTSSKRKGELKFAEEYARLIAEGKDEDTANEEAQNIAGIRPLINTGQLRNALAYTIRRKRK